VSGSDEHSSAARTWLRSHLGVNGAETMLMRTRRPTGHSVELKDWREFIERERHPDHHFSLTVGAVYQLID
jgi:hypothetical protein